MLKPRPLRRNDLRRCVLFVILFDRLWRTAHPRARTPRTKGPCPPNHCRPPQRAHRFQDERTPRLSEWGPDRAGTAFQTTWRGVPPPAQATYRNNSAIRSATGVPLETNAHVWSVSRWADRYLAMSASECLNGRYLFGDDESATGRTPRCFLQNMQFCAIRKPVPSMNADKSTHSIKPIRTGGTRRIRVPSHCLHLIG